MDRFCHLRQHDGQGRPGGALSRRPLALGLLAGDGRAVSLVGARRPDRHLTAAGVALYAVLATVSASPVSSPPPLVQLPPCLVIKPYVALYGVEATIEWAQRHGYTQGQINDIRKRCAI